MNQLAFMLGLNAGAADATSDDVRIHGKHITVTTPEGLQGEMPLAKLLDVVSRRSDPFRNVCWPDGVRATFSEWPMAVVVLEIAPAVHRLKWISSQSKKPYGAGCTYEMRPLSLPYLVLFCTWAWHPEVTGDGGLGGLRLTQRNEVYFRTKAMSSLDEPVFFPTLLNASKYYSDDGGFYVPGKNGVWLCNQHMPLRLYNPLPLNERVRQSLVALTNYLLHSGFNYSGGATNPQASAGGEQCSYFEYCVQQGIDERIATVERWEEETRKNPLFSLDINYIPSGLTIRKVAERILKEFSPKIPPITSASDLSRLVLSHSDSDKCMQINYPHPMWPTPT